MTKDELLEQLPGESHHAAWSSFVDKMAQYEYGRHPLAQAWHFYREGWDAHVAASRDLLHRLSYALDGLGSAQGYVSSYIDEVNKP